MQETNFPFEGGKGDLYEWHQKSGSRVLRGIFFGIEVSNV